VNKYDYEYGNKFNINTALYYKFSIKNKLSVAPSMGVQFETAQQDLDKGLAVEVSGGIYCWALLVWKPIIRKLPLVQIFKRRCIRTWARHNQANNRCMVHVSFAL
jgi:hypothetical protein